MRLSYPEQYRPETRRQPADKFSKQLDNFKVIVIYGGSTLVMVTGLFFGIKYLVKKSKHDAASKNALDAQSPENIATRIRQGFENDYYPGTNEDLIYSAFNDIPTQAFYQKVRVAYANLFDSSFFMGLTKDLAADLQSKLSSDEYQKVITILNSKP